MPSAPKQKVPKGQPSNSSATTNDPRFAALSSNPRFRLPSRKHTHVKLDKRFSRILNDDSFSSKASVDRYGRKIDKGRGKKELERLYRMGSDDDDEAEQSGDDDGDTGLKTLKQTKRLAPSYDPARDGGFSTSEDDSDTDEDSEDDVENEAELYNDEQEDTQVPLGEVTARIGIVNLDWDNIRAVDLMAVSTSFAPAGGRILSVAVYPSNFGKERMDREELEGPPREIFEAGRNEDKMKSKSSKKPVAVTIEPESDESDSDSENEQIKKQLLREDTGAEFNSAALRRYQLDRLRYFYAVVSCSSKDVAKALYDAMDGREYLSSANFFDMRFIPDEVEFEADKPRDTCKELPDGYRPEEFVTSALTHSKVTLTWDADDNKRKEVQKRAFSRKEMDENDLLAYIGSASESSEEEMELVQDTPDADVVSSTSRETTLQAKREAMRARLGLDLEPPSRKKGQKEDRIVGDMQITFTPALSGGKQNGGSVFENEPPPPEETTAEKYRRKEKERKAARKERARLRRDEPGAEKEEVNGKKSRKEDEELEQDSDEHGSRSDADPFADPFFDDPAAVQKKAREDRKAEKASRRRETEDKSKASSAKQAELELLMMDEDANTKGVQHFSMKEIERAEKDSKKNKKNKKTKKKTKYGVEQEEATKLAAEDDFRIEVQDPRFAPLFQSHEFAIDPTNPKFRDTKGMKQMMEEGRRRRKDQIEPSEDSRGKKRARESVKDESVLDLVDKVKKRVKK
jgi:hypothetical protein